MLRDKSLIPLSHQHQHALALCVRIDRASPIDAAVLHVWQNEVAQEFEQEISIHFAAEEQVLFPAARDFPELVALVAELMDEHHTLRDEFSRAQTAEMNATDLLTFAQRLSAHIRKEERQLFERMQTLTSPAALQELGTRLTAALKDAKSACALPREETRLRARKD